MTNRVQLANCVFYDVDEVHVENDPERGSGVYIKLISYAHTDNEFLPASGQQARRHMALSSSVLTCFRWDSEDPPVVFVDGKRIEPNPQPAQEEPEEVD